MKPAYSIQWMVRRQMPQVVEIEKYSFEKPWSDAEFTKHLRQRNVIGMVAESDGVVLGYMVYALHGQSVELLNIAVAPEHLRSGIGTALIDKLKSKLSPVRRQRLKVIVSEKNLNAQLFFKSQGMHAKAVVHDHFSTGEAAYHMQYSVRLGIRFSLFLNS